MPKKVILTEISSEFESGSLEEWHVVEGDHVTAGDVIAEISTDKAVVEFEAADTGTIGKLLVAAGTADVAVNTPIAILLFDGETAEDLQGFMATAEVIDDFPQSSVNPESLLPMSSKTMSAERSNDRQFSSPYARRRAHELGISIASIRGSGPAGRIVSGDIEPKESYETLPNDAVRKTIARRLTESKQSVPHFYLTIDCEVDMLSNIRRQLNRAATRRQRDYRLSLNDFVVRASAMALRDTPRVNASWTDEAIRQYVDVDISLAVDTPRGLLTPVIRQADTKDLLGLSSEIKYLAERARAGSLKPEELKGGGFTISNLGMFGVREFSAIINPPQSCILAVGAAEQRPVVEQGVLKTATVMTCTLSVDHRCVDGALGAKFLQTFKGLIEKPSSMFVSSAH